MLKNNNLIMKQTNEWKAKWNSTPKKTLENSTFSLKLSSYLTLIINAWDCHYWKTWPLGFVMIKSNICTILSKNACEDSLNPFSPTPTAQKKEKKKIQNLNKVQKERGSIRVQCLNQKISTQTTPTRPETWSWNSQWRVIKTQNNNDKNTLY